MGVTVDPEQNETRVMHDLVEFSGKDVLEVGCGDGRVTWRYADQAASVLALDPDELDSELAREDTPDHLRSKVSFRVADITELELPEAGFDVVVLSWSL